MSYLKTILLGFIGGAVAWLLLLPLSGNAPEESAPISTPTPIVVSSDFWQKIASDHVLNTVAIQSFKSGKITREGTGMTISSDGIIITTFDVIAGADVYQVLYGDKILRAQLVRYDGFKNLALLKVSATDMTVTRLERSHRSEERRVGKECRSR